MKTMTCRQMGGECDLEIQAKTSVDMAKKMTAHVYEAHPQVAKGMEKMSPQEREKWEEEFHKNWDAAPKA